MISIPIIIILFAYNTNKYQLSLTNPREALHHGKGKNFKMVM